MPCEFSQDGTLLAIGEVENRDQTSLGVYEVASGRRLFTVPGSNGAFAPDGKSLVAWKWSGAERNTARRVSIPDGRLLTEFTYENYHHINPRSDGRWFFQCTEAQPGIAPQVRIWDIASGKVVHSFTGPVSDDEGSVSVLHAPGKRELIVADAKSSRVWCRDLDTGKELWQADLPKPVGDVVLSADGTTLVACDKEGTVTVRNATTGERRQTFSAGAVGHSAVVDVSPDGKTIATESGRGQRSKSVVFWDTATGKLLSDPPGHRSAITAVTFGPDGKSAFTVGRDHTLRTWDMISGRELARSASTAEHLVASADGTSLFAARPDGRVQVLDVRTGKTIREFRVFTGRLIGLAWTADGKQLVAGGQDKDDPDGDAIRVIDPATGATVRAFHTEGRLEKMAVHPNGETIIASYPDRKVIVWSSTGKRVAEHRGQGRRKPVRVMGEIPDTIGAVAASADGRWFAYSDQEEGIGILNAQTGRQVKRMRLADLTLRNPLAHYEIRDVLAFAPDGKTIAWSGTEGHSAADVHVIEVTSGQVRRKLPGDSYPVRSLAFAPDGATLVSAGPDGLALVWDVAGRMDRKPEGVPNPAQVLGWWNAIGGGPAETADAAMREMVAHPVATVAMVRERLKPVKPVDAARLNRLVARLGAASFDNREAAARDLIALGNAAVPRLREAATSSDPEVASRSAAMLERIDLRELPERIRAERAVEVLERIADPAAADLLRELAQGMPGAHLTIDAAGAVTRMTAGGKSRP